MSDIEKRVSTLEANEQARKQIEEVRAQQRAQIDQELADAVKCLRKEVYELKSWKLKLYYPFAIIGFFAMGVAGWLGTHLFNFFTGE